jgi:autotransporter-associated beta strand protein
MTLSEGISFFLCRMKTFARCITAFGFLSLAAVGNLPAQATLYFNNGENYGSNTDTSPADLVVDINSGTGTHNGLIFGTGSLTKTGAGTIILSQTNTYDGGTSITDGVLQIGNGGAGGALPGDAVNEGTLVFNIWADYTYNGVISGSGGVVQDGYILRFANPQTYTGPTSIRNGAYLVLSTTADQGLSASTTIEMEAGSVFDFSNRLLTIAGLSGSGTIYSFMGGNPAAGHLTLNIADGESYAYAGVLGSNTAEQFGLTKSGAGTQILSGTNIYTGTTTITGGVLSINADAALGAAPASATPGHLTLDGGNLATTETFTLNANRGIALGTSGGTFETATGTTLTYGGIVAGSGNLTKSGAGTLTLTGTNTSTGSTTVNAGTLAVTNTAQLGSGNLTVTSGGALSASSLEITGPRTITVTGTGSTLTTDSLQLNRGGTADTQTLNVADGGNVIVNGNLSLADENTASVGNLNITGAGSSLNATGNVQLGVAGNGTATVANGGTLSTGGVLSANNSTEGTSTFNLNSGGTLQVGGSGGIDFAPQAVFNANGGTIEVIGSDLTTSTALTLGTASDSTVDTNGLNATFSGAISGDGALTKTGAGTLTLTENNTFSGGTTIAGGTLQISADTKLGDSNSTLTMNGGTLATSADFTLSSSRAVVIGTSGGTFETASSTTLSVDTIGGTSSGVLNKTGEGTLVVENQIENNGAVTVSEGTLSLNNAEIFGASSTHAVTVNSPGILALNDQSQIIGSLAGSGSVTAGSATLTAGGNNTSTAFSGELSGTGELVKTGTGTFTLSGDNTNFSGTTTVEAGTLTLGSANALPASALVVLENSATLDLDDLDRTLAGIESYSDSTTIALGSATLTTGDANDRSLDAAITGTGSLVKVGSGTFELDGANTYSGSTTVSEGILSLTASNSLNAASAVSVASGATLSLQADLTIQSLDGAGTIELFSVSNLTTGDADDHSLSGPMTGGGALTKAGTGSLTLSGENTYEGETTVSAGTLTLASNTALGDTYTGTTVASGATLAFTNDIAVGAEAIENSGTVSNASGNNTYTGDLSGSGALTVAGGSLTLSGNNSYSGATTVSAGTLTIASDTALGDSATGTTVASGATLELTNGIAIGAEAISNAGTVTSASGNNSYAGVLSGTGDLTVGSGSLTLSGVNSYSGDTTVEDGATLLLINSGQITQTNHVSVDNGSLRLSHGSQMVALGDLTLDTAETPFASPTMVIEDSTSFDLTGNATLNGGAELEVRNLGALSVGGNVTLNEDAVLDLANGSTAITGQLALNDNSTLNMALSPIRTIGSLSVSDAATVTLSSGARLLSSGDITVGGTSDLSASFGTTLHTETDLIFATDANDHVTVSTNYGALSAAGDIVIGQNGRADVNLTYGSVNPGGVLILAENIGSTANLTVTGTTLSLSGENGFRQGSGTANVILDTATINVGLPGLTSGVDLTLINQNGIVTSGADAHLSGILGGTGGLTKSDPGTLTLSGDNTYEGSTTVTLGSLILASDTALGDTTTGTTVASGATLAFTNNIDVGAEAIANSGTVTNTSGANSYGGVLSGSGALTVEGGSLTLSGTNTYSGDTTVNAGTLTLASDSALGNTSVGTTVASGATLAFTNNIAVGSEAIVNSGTVANPSGNNSYAGTLSGIGELTVDGGSLTLSGDNTFTGNTTVSAGTLTLAADAALGNTSAGTSVASGATLAFTNNIAVGAEAINSAGNVTNVSGDNSYAGTLSGGGILTVESGSLALSGTNTFTGSTTVSGGTLSINADAALGASPASPTPGHLTINGGTLATTDSFELNANRGLTIGENGGALNTAADTTLTYNGTLAGSGDFTKEGVGTLTLGGSSSYTGDLSINAGTLNLQTADFLSSSNAVTLGSTATFALNNYDQTIGSLAGEGTTALGTAALTVGGDNSSTLYTGSITGSGGSLEKVGSGTLSLASTNTYTGGTTITAGTLLGNAHSLQGDITNNATLTIDQVTTGVFNGSITGTGNLVKNGGGNLTLNGTNTYSGGTTIASGRLIGTTDALQGDILNHGVVMFTQTTDGTYAGNLSGSGIIEVLGTGALTLAGNNSYTGATEIAQGTLRIGSASALGSTSTVYLYDAGILDLNNYSLTTPSIAGTGQIHLGSGVLSTGNGGDYTFSGVISGSGGSLNKVGTGRLTLSGANTYTGGTTIMEGTLSIAADNALGAVPASATPGNLTLNGGTLATTGTIEIAANRGILIDSSGGTINTDDGTTLTYGGAFEGSGSLTKRGQGTLSLSGSSPSYNGDTTVQEGTLSLAAAQALNGNLYIQGGAVNVVNSAALENATLHWSGSGNLDFTTNTEAWLGGLASVGSNSSNFLQEGLTLYVGGNDADTTFGGYAGGTGTFVKEGSGTFTFEGSFIDQGVSVRLDEGTFALASGSDNALANATVILNYGTFDFGNNSSANFGALSGSGNLTLENSTSQPVSLTVGNNSADTAYTGTLSGSGSLTKIGSGTLTLSSNHSFTGDTTISSGTLVLDTTNTLAGDLYLTGGTLRLGNADAAASSTVYQNDNTPIDYNGHQYVSFGGLGGTGDLNLPSGSLTIGGNGRNTVFSGSIAGEGTLIKEGSGTLTLANTLSDDSPNLFRISSGSVSLQSSSALYQTTVEMDGGTVDFGNHSSATFGGLSGSDYLTLENDDNQAVALTVGENDTNTTFFGSLQGAGSLIKAGSGTLTFEGYATNSGGFRIDEGTFDFADGSISGSTLHLSSGNLILGSGSLDDVILRFSGGNLRIEDSSVLENSLLQLESYNTIDFDGNSDVSFGAISGGGQLDLPNGNLYLNGLSEAATFNGTIRGDGTLIIYGGTHHFAGSFASDSNATLEYDSGTFNLRNSDGLEYATVRVESDNFNFDGITSATFGGLEGYGRLTLANDDNQNVALTVGYNNSNSEFSGELSGGGSLTKVGTGNLTLSSSNYFEGPTTVQSGTLTLDDDYALQNSTLVTSSSSNVVINSSEELLLGGLAGDGSISLSNGTLNVGRNDESTDFSGSLSGGMNLTKSGQGTLTLQGSNAFTGVTTVSEGGLEIAHSEALQNSIVNPGSGLVFTSAVTEATFGGLDDNGYGGQSFSLENESNNAVALTLDVTSGESHEFAAELVGSGSLIKTGSGTQTLTGNNTFTGGTTVNGGTLVLDGQNAGGSGDVSVASGGTLQVRDEWALQNATLITSSSGGTIDFDENSTITLGGLAGDGNLANLNLSVGGNDFDTTYSGVLSGSNLSLVKEGTGTWTLAGANTFSGTATVLEGTLVVAHSGALQNAIVDPGTGLEFSSINLAIFAGLSGDESDPLELVNNFGSAVEVTLDVPNGIEETPNFRSEITGSGSLVKTGTGTQILSGSNNYEGSTTITGGVLSLASSDALGATPGSFEAAHLTINGGTLQTDMTVTLQSNHGVTLGSSGGVFDTRSDLAIYSVISGEGALTKTGEGILSLSGANTYTGDTNVNSGTLLVGNDNALQFSTLTGSGAVEIDYGTQPTLGGLAGSLNVTLPSDTTLTVGNNNSNTTFSGTIDGDYARLVKIGTGTLTLSGTNTYTDTTTIEGGTLAIGADAALGAAPETPSANHLILNGGTLANTASFALNENRGISLGTNGGTFDIADATTLTQTASITGEGNLTKVGDGKLVLSGQNDYTGETHISAGVLETTTSNLGYGVVSITGTGALQMSNPISIFSQDVTIDGSSARLDGSSVPGTVVLFSAIDEAHEITIRNGGTVTGNTVAFGGVLNDDNFFGLPAADYALVINVESGSLIAAMEQVAVGTGSYGGVDLTVSGSGSQIIVGDSENPDALAGMAIGYETASASSVTVSNGGSIYADNLRVGFPANDSFLHIADGGTVTTSSLAIDGDNNLVQIDSGGTLHVTGDFDNGLLAGSIETSSGSTNSGILLNGGTLQVSRNNIYASADLQLGASSTSTFAIDAVETWWDGAVSGSGNLTKSGSGSLVLAGSTAYTGATTVSEGTLQIGAGGTIDFASSSLTNNGTVIFDHNNTFTYNNPVLGNGLLIKDGTGTLNLNDVSGYTGTARLDDGVLNLGGANTLADVSVEFNGGQLGTGSLSGIQLGALSGSNTVSLNNDNAQPLTLTVGAGNLSSSFSGQLSGGGSLVKTGTGTLALTGASDYTGGTTLSAGTLEVGHNAALGTGTLNLAGGTLRAGSAGVNLVNNVNLTAGSTLGGSEGFTVSGTVNLQGFNTLNVTNTARTTLSGGIGESTPSILIKQGDGELELTGASTYTGGTFIQSGTVRINNTNGSAFGTGAVTIGEDATLAGSGSFTGAMQINGTFAPGNSPGATNTGSQTWAAGGLYLWEINDVMGEMGQNPGWDVTNITGSLNITATSENPFTIDLTTLDLADELGLAANFDNTLSYQWTVAFATSGIYGFDTNKFFLETTGFQNALGGGSFGLQLNGNALQLTFTAVPEPGTWALLLGSLALGLVWARRRKLKSVDVSQTVS